MSLAATVLLLCVSAYGQIEIRIPQQRYKRHDKIDVVIANTSTKQVSLCVEYGHSSFRDADHTESTPTPVYVQRKDKRGWRPKWRITRVLPFLLPWKKSSSRHRSLVNLKRRRLP
jgi:hypothetical protein